MSSLQTSRSSSSSWLSNYAFKFRFFIGIRRLLKSKSSGEHHYRPSDHINTPKTSKTPGLKEEIAQEETQDMRLVEEDDSIVLQRSVKQLNFGSLEEKEMAAKEIKRLAKDDVRTRKSLAMLGVIPSLVSMIDSNMAGRRRSAMEALIELATGTYTNKALMVEAGFLSKLSKNINGVDEQTRHGFAQLLVSISLLANTQFPLALSQILPFIIAILESTSSIETKELCLGTLYNLSTVLDNAGFLVTHGVVNTLLQLSLVKEASEKSLATLANLVVTLMGKRAMESNNMVPENLIEIMTWEEKPKCQEVSAYVLMILAHQSSVQRQKMANAGIVQVLLEVALLGSPLAQKRALKLLQWFKDERQTKMGPHSGPQTGRVMLGSPVNQRETEAGKRMMKKLVKESLDKNMDVITRRAHNASGDTSTLRALFISSSSKSLPY